MKINYCNYSERLIAFQAMAHNYRYHALENAVAHHWEKHSPKTFIPGKTYIPATAKHMTPDDMYNLVDACLDMWLTEGRYAKEFSEKLSAQMGKNSTNSAVLTNSGSSANLLAVTAMGLKAGAEVITVAAGFPTTVNPIIQNGLVPVFVDVDPFTLSPSLEALQAAVSDKTAAVVLAHPLGNPFRADLVAKWCEKRGYYFIEDCCDALGATIGNRPVGSFGDYATFSFYPAHQITTGEGGAIVSKDAIFRRRVERLRDWGRDCWCDTGKDNTCQMRFGWNFKDLPKGYDHKYTYSAVGYNLKMTDMQAALGVSQLKKLHDFVTKRQNNWNLLNFEIKNSAFLSEHLSPVRIQAGTNPSWFGFPMYLTSSVNRSKLTQYLEEHRVGTRLLFGGNLTKQPAYWNVKYRKVGELPETDQIMNNLFWIGVHPGINKRMISYMVKTLEEGIRAQL